MFMRQNMSVIQRTAIFGTERKENFSHDSLKRGDYDTELLKLG